MIKIIFLIAFLLCASLISAEYYADVIINVDQTGEVEISGLSNHPQLQETKTSEYTIKDKQFWTLNITLNEKFSDFVYEIRFPKETTINYIQSPNKIGISNIDGDLVISGIGKNEKFFVIAQYSFNNKSQNDILYLIIVLIFIVVGSIVLFRFKKSPKPKINLNTLTERQKEIVNIILKNKNGITQAELQKQTNLPKASLSRNIETLTKKGIIIKEEKGMTNIIFIKKN